MAKSDIIEKNKLLIDGDEIPGLTARDAANLESDIVEVPGYDRTVSVVNGVQKIPSFLLTYKVGPDTSTLQFLRDWYIKKEQKECVLQRFDGNGNLFEQIDLGFCELGSNNIPPYAAEAPVYSQIQALLVPERYDIIQ